jgi:hypothetical protein
MLLIIAAAFAVGLMILTGIASQVDGLSARPQEGAHELQSWAEGLGVKAPTAADANAHADARSRMPSRRLRMVSSAASTRSPRSPSFSPSRRRRPYRPR